MPPNDSPYPADWLRIADEDLERVKSRISLHDPADAGFHLQQAVEKFLKAFLLSKGWKLKRIHDLEILLNAALPHDPSLEQFRTVCQRITDFYAVERYPFLAKAGLTLEVARAARARVWPLIEALRKALAGYASG